MYIFFWLNSCLNTFHSNIIFILFTPYIKPTLTSAKLILFKKVLANTFPLLLVRSTKTVSIILVDLFLYFQSLFFIWNYSNLHQFHPLSLMASHTMAIPSPPSIFPSVFNNMYTTSTFPATAK